MAVGTQDGPTREGIISLKDRAAWKEALESPRPVLAHLNADTTWLLQLPTPAGSVDASRDSQPAPKNTTTLRPPRYNILIDPWLQGPQSDVASWFSTQWHVVAPTVQTMKELEDVLAEVQGHAGGHIDCVAVSHEFSDHCHKETLLELSKTIPVVATEKAADLIRSWKHFETVMTAPGFSASAPSWRNVLVDRSGAVPPWLGIGRVITEGNALYYHSALMIAFERGDDPSQPSTQQHAPPENPSPPARRQTEAVIYSPHGIKAPDLECIREAGIKTLALLHGLHDVRIRMTAQLNLGALNGIQAVRASGAKYWVATHDEVKKGGGFISWLLWRRAYSLRDAVAAEGANKSGQEGPYDFVELGSGDGLILV